MYNWIRQLGIVFALGISSPALAYPPQCNDVCKCSSSCAKGCSIGTYPTTCAEWEVCVDECRHSTPEASLSPEAQEQQDVSRDVCTEQDQESVSAES